MLAGRWRSQGRGLARLYIAISTALVTRFSLPLIDLLAMAMTSRARSTPEGQRFVPCGTWSNFSRPDSFLRISATPAEPSPEDDYYLDNEALLAHTHQGHSFQEAIQYQHGYLSTNFTGPSMSYDGYHYPLADASDRAFEWPDWEIEPDTLQGPNPRFAAEGRCSLISLSLYVLMFGGVSPSLRKFSRHSTPSVRLRTTSASTALHRLDDQAGREPREASALATLAAPTSTSQTKSVFRFAPSCGSSDHKSNTKKSHREASRFSFFKQVGDFVGDTSL